MTNEIRIPFGACDVTYDGITLPTIADEAIFQAIPTYSPVYGGAGNTIQKYILESYEVTFTVLINHESYETLKLHSPILKNHVNGLYDDASNVDMTGKRLVVHPHGTDSKEFDLCIWEAYISPENGFTRTFKKEADTFEIRFVGKPSNFLADINSYFFIGDWSKVGVINE
ncbi:hypothetical protein NSQ77_20000 [Oceanobacillus sp. FSL K6-2867]|uniref:hypothetical protein n=1 Tax=Oceanobacillus sp. FSL K6-2867 TaxID=2954748 RepID=UPI0030D7D108